MKLRRSLCCGLRCWGVLILCILSLTAHGQPNGCTLSFGFDSRGSSSSTSLDVTQSNATQIANATVAGSVDIIFTDSPGLCKNVSAGLADTATLSVSGGSLRINNASVLSPVQSRNAGVNVTAISVVFGSSDTIDLNASLGSASGGAKPFVLHNIPVNVTVAGSQPPGSRQLASNVLTTADISGTITNADDGVLVLHANMSMPLSLLDAGNTSVPSNVTVQFTAAANRSAAADGRVPAAANNTTPAAGGNMLAAAVQPAADGSCPVCPVCPAMTDSQLKLQPNSQCFAGNAASNNSAAGGCECLNSWSGSACQMCTSDASCGALLGVNGTCIPGVQYAQNTHVLGYSCSITNPALAALLGSVSAVCSRTPQPFGTDISSTAQQQMTEFFGGSAGCMLQLEINNSPIRCHSTNCQFTAPGSAVACDTPTCVCPTCSAELNDTIHTMLAKKPSIDCQPDGTCQMELTGATTADSLSVDIRCDASQCVIPGQANVDSNGAVQLPSPPKTGAWLAVLACIPMVLLLLLAVACSLWILIDRSMFSSYQTLQLLKSGTATATDFGGAVQPQHGAPVQLQWRSVSCSVQSTKISFQSGAAQRRKRGEELMILRDVSGAAMQGQVTGMLGPSGSGKSTLLSILSGSQHDVAPYSTVTGDVELHGLSARPITEVRKYAAYVPQFDDLLPCLTVEECLRYAALLRLPMLSSADLNRRIARVICDLGLTDVAASMVGGKGGVRGISGGERRRVGIAMEMLPDPLLLVMDEPTSGLDSFTASRLLQTCQEIAQRGRVVLMSLHQPSPDMFMRLDHVIILAAGRVAYCGSPHDATSTLARAGLDKPAHQAVADFLLEIVSEPHNADKLVSAADDVSQQTAQTEAAEYGKDGEGNDTCRVVVGSKKEELDHAVATGSFDGSEPSRTTGCMAGACMRSDTASAAKPRNGKVGVLRLEFTRSDEKIRDAEAASADDSNHLSMQVGKASWMKQYVVLFWRGLLDIARNRALLLMHVTSSLLLGALVGVIFLNQGLDQAGAQNRLGAVFFTLALFGFFSLTSLDLLMSEKHLVFREVRARYYGTFPYLMSKITLDGLLLRAVPVLCYTMFVYPLMGLQSGSAKVAVFCFTLSVFTATYGVLCIALAPLVRTSGQASFMVTLVLLMSILVGGYLVNLHSIPAGVRWLHYLSLVSYAFEALVSNELRGVKMNFTVPSIGSAKITGELFLQLLGLDTDNFNRDVVIVVVFYVAAVAFAAVTMHCAVRRTLQSWYRCCCTVRTK